jgi:hypothetical protein
LESIGSEPAKTGQNYWCRDENRIGLKTIEINKITALEVKPIGKAQWHFKPYYL